MILCAALPRIVGIFMVVGLGEHREGLVDALQIGVGAITRIAQAIVGEHDRLVPWLDHASGQCLAERGISADRIFVEIVADMDDEVDILALRGVRIGVEISEGQVGAGKQRQCKTRPCIDG